MNLGLIDCMILVAQFVVLLRLAAFLFPTVCRVVYKYNLVYELVFKDRRVEVTPEQYRKAQDNIKNGRDVFHGFDDVTKTDDIQSTIDKIEGR